MNSFERVAESEPNEEPIGREEEKKEVLEQNFDTETALREEKSVLEQFRGKAKNIAKVMLLVSALSVGPGMAKEAWAQKTQSAIKVEQIDQAKDEEQKIEINEANLTASSKWSGEIIEAAKNNMNKVKTAKDAEQLVRLYFNPFVTEFYMPTQGRVEEGPYGIKVRHYTEDDTKYLLQNAQEMKELLQELNDKFSIEAFDKRMRQINDMIKKLERRSSYAGQQKERLLHERLKEILK
ncbi:hypothetical protein J7J23_02350 [bacterium]|nr:hypothetical protein [bacterium]